jgi:hypothetical protein
MKDQTNSNPPLSANSKDTFNGASFQPDAQLALIVETSIVDVHVAVDSQGCLAGVPVVPRLAFRYELLFLRDAERWKRRK